MSQQPSVLIIGASRGIGLGLAQLHIDHGWTVHATTRDGKPPAVTGEISTYRLEVRDPTHLNALVADLEPVDRIIHNAGVLRAPRQELFDVNTEAPIRIVQRLLDEGLLRPDGELAIMTSQMGARRGRSGSLGDYGDSKAALNDGFRARADVWRDKGAIAVVIHPGWVKTDMGGPGASISVDESVQGVKRLLDELSESQHGSFLTWDGRTHPW